MFVFVKNVRYLRKPRYGRWWHTIRSSGLNPTSNNLPKA